MIAGVVIKSPRSGPDVRTRHDAISSILRIGGRIVRAVTARYNV